MLAYMDGSKGTYSDKRSWHNLPNDIPTVNSSFNYEQNTSIVRGLTQTHSTFVLVILKHLNIIETNKV